MMSPNVTLEQAVALHKAGKFKEAEPLYSNILESAPEHFDALHMLGVLYLQTRRNADALALITRAVAANPGSAAALNNQGNALRALERYEEALASYERAAATDPAFVEAVKNRGDIFQIMGNHSQAIVNYDQVLANGQPYPEVLNNRGASLQYLRRIDEALADYDRALVLKPSYVLAMKNRGKALETLRRYEEALASYRRALKTDKDSIDCLAGVASALRALKRFDEALNVCDQVLSKKSDDLQTLNIRGVALRDMQRYEDSLICFDRAIALKPNHLEALVNRGTTLHEMGRSEDALMAFDRALSFQPEHAEAHWNRSLTLLMNRRFAEGWEEFEWRLKCPNITTRAGAFHQPRWNGENPKQGALLIWGEQGVGDEILYAGMIDDLVARDISIVWDVDARLRPLIARNYPSVRTITRATPPDPATRETTISAQISTASLGQYLRRNSASFPIHRRAYLKADGNKTRDYRAKLLKNGATRLIGVSWVSQNLDFGVHKSMPLAHWAPLWKNAGTDACFVDLQYGDTADERAAAPFEIAHVDGLDLFHDLDGLAALIAACDLVITVSNTTAHLAGALGIPAWVLLPKGNGRLWYWGADQTTSLWYPSVTLFRQQTPGNWKDVIARVSKRLTEFA